MSKQIDLMDSRILRFNGDRKLRELMTDGLTAEELIQNNPSLASDNLENDVRNAIFYLENKANEDTYKDWLINICS